LDISGDFLGSTPPYFFLITASCKYTVKLNCAYGYNFDSLTVEAKLAKSKTNENIQAYKKSKG
jgi:hypothetical protein